MVRRICTKFFDSIPKYIKVCACLIMCNAMQVCTCQSQTFFFGGGHFLGIQCVLLLYVYVDQKCRESSSSDAECASQQTLNDVTMSAKLKEVDLTCQLSECGEKLLIAEQQVTPRFYNEMCYINLCFTYHLLYYLLTCCHRKSSATTVDSLLIGTARRLVPTERCKRVLSHYIFACRLRLVLD